MRPWPKEFSAAPFPLTKALPLFRQIAEGLEAAHEKGIIHRDLKPANVKVAPGGNVKVLDFGLGKMWALSEVENPQSESPTITRNPTESGVILGTAAYMSPEQARGKNLDKRTDIWSFGCCLFEALTARAVFLGETVSDTLAKILETEPHWEALPDRTPRRVRELLASCLTKDPRMRLHDIADARIEIVKALAEPAESTPERAPRDRKILVPAAVVLAVVSAGLALWSLGRSPHPTNPTVIRSLLPFPDGESLFQNPGPSVAISPDGRYVAYVAGRDTRRLYLRRVDVLEPRLIEGSEGALTPIFSPDSQWIAFVKDRLIYRAAVSGGAPLRVSNAGYNPNGMDWSGEELVFTGSTGDGLFRAPAAGGEREVLTVLDRDRGEKSHRFPHVLPGAQSVLFTVGTTETDSWDEGRIAVASMETGVRKIVLEGGTQARYSPTGHLVYARGGTLHAVGFDPGNLQVTGQPVPVLPRVMMDRSSGEAQFALSDDGTLVYVPGLSRTDDRRVVWIDRHGRVEPLIETPRMYQAPRLSPDGRTLALQVSGGLEAIWLYEIARGSLARLTFEWDNATPVWAPSGREIAFTSARAGAWDLYRRAVDGGEAERIAVSDHTKIPTSWSPDGATLLYQEYGIETGTDLWKLALSDGLEAKPFLNGRANELWSAFSPDGEWVAYQSDGTGRFEVYVCRFPDCDRKQQVSTDGGTYPVWRSDGKELFYRSGNRMMAVAVDTGRDLVLGRPVMLFETPEVRATTTIYETFAVMPDGERFIVLDGSVAEALPTHLVLVQNFDEELKRLVPTTQ